VPLSGVQLKTEFYFSTINVLGEIPVYLLSSECWNSIIKLRGFDELLTSLKL
jgi:hypothetical protein